MNNAETPSGKPLRANLSIESMLDLGSMSLKEGNKGLVCSMSNPSKTRCDKPQPINAVSAVELFVRSSSITEIETIPFSAKEIP